MIFQPLFLRPLIESGHKLRAANRGASTVVLNQTTQLSLPGLGSLTQSGGLGTETNFKICCYFGGKIQNFVVDQLEKSYEPGK